MDTSTRREARHDHQDNKRAFRWGAVVAAVLVAGALGYNLLSRDRAGPMNPETPSNQVAPAPEPSSTAGGQSGAAGPGTGGGRNTGDGSGTGAPRQ